MTLMQRTLGRRALRAPHRPRLSSHVAPGAPVSLSTPPPRFVSAYGSALHGHHRGPQASFAEPLNSWLALLGDAVPFYKDCLVICPSSMPEPQVRALWQRAREHMPSAHIAVMKEREPSCAALSVQHAARRVSSTVERRESSAEVGALVRTSSSAAPAPSSSEGDAVPAVAPASPLSGVPAGSFDVIVFAGNVFARDALLYEVPWHVSLAHRALRPHGVLGIFGYDSRIRVSAPAWAAEDMEDFYVAMQEEVELTLRDLRRADHDSTTESVEVLQRGDQNRRRQSSTDEEREEAEEGGPPDPRMRRRIWATELEKAREICLSESIAHVDTYLPFLAVQRRWFVSEYAMTPEDVAACVRSLRPFQLLRAIERERELLGVPASPVGAMMDAGVRMAKGCGSGATANDKGEAAATTPSSSSSPSCAATHGQTSPSADRDDDFVDTAPDLSFCLSSNRPDGLGGCFRPVNVRRRTHAMEPLEALEGCWHARLALESPVSTRQTGATRGRASSSSSPPSPPALALRPLRGQVRHFVITCSNRGINATGEAAPLPASSNSRASGGKGRLLPK